jgi:DNA replication licensing factor MCM6
MALRGEGLAEEDQPGAGGSSAASRIVYVLHPNCAVEEF